MNNISLVTITFHKDFNCLEKQLTSLNMYYKKNLTHNIILNDDEIYLTGLQNIVSKFKYFNYKIYHFSNFDLSHQTVELDWFNQQILKLQACNIIDTKFYLIFDSKDYVTQYHDFNELIANDIPSLNYDKHDLYKLDTSYSNSFKFFNLNPDEHRDFVTDGRTPFIMETEHTKSLLNYIEDSGIKLNQLITPTTDHTKRHTEFYLYNAWLEKNNVKVNWVKELILGQKIEYECRIKNI
jgi:hypothetical protein